MKKPKNLKKWREKVEKLQDARRFEHTLGVEYTAAALAMSCGASVTDARIAGILHDCAKCISDGKKLAICKKNQIPISEIEARNPYLLHAKVGAWLAREKFGVEEEDILNAISSHTTGREEMSLLEKIIFVADYIEPGRKHLPAEKLQEIRKLAFQDLDAAMFWILDLTLCHLRKGKREIDPLTEAAWRCYEPNSSAAAHTKEVAG